MSVQVLTEERLIGQLLRKPERYEAVLASGIAADDFDSPDLGRVFDAAGQLWRKCGSFGLHSLASVLPESMPLLVRLDKEAGIGDAVSYATAMKRFAWTRDTALRLSELASTVAASDPLQDVEAMQHKVAEAARQITDSKIGKVASVSTADLATKFLDAFESRSASTHQGIQTGIRELDRVVGGWGRGRLIIIGARPGVGKTTLAVQCALHASALNKVGFISIEMTADDLFDSLVARVGGVNSRAVRDGDLSEMDRIYGAAKDLYARNLQIYQCDGDFASVTTEMRKLAAAGCKLLIVDYLQLLRDSSRRFSTRAAELTHISASLKQMALSLNVAIIATAQLNREADSEDPPKLSQLKDSGSIEQDADVAILLHRPNPDEPTLHLMVEKNRVGKRGALRLRCDYTTGTIE